MGALARENYVAREFDDGSRFISVKAKRSSLSCLLSSRKV